MSVSIAKITNFQVKGIVNPSIVGPLSDVINILLPLNFASVQNLQVIKGSFTPANNSKTLISGLTTISPNFLIFICDGNAVISTDNSMYASLAVNKFLMTVFPVLVGGTNPIDSVSLNGTVSAPYAMTQGVPLNYTMILGQATIT